MLYFVNIPYNCSDNELRNWIEARGIQTRSIRMIRDFAAGVSPAYAFVEIRDDSRTPEAVSILNGQRMRNQVIRVEAVEIRTVRAAA